MHDNNSKSLALYVFVADAFVLSWQFDMIEQMINELAIDQIYYYEMSHHPSVEASLFLSLLFKLDSLLSNCQLNTLGKQALDNLSVKTVKLAKNDFISAINNAPENGAIAVNLTEHNLDNSFLEKISSPVFSVFIGKETQTVSSLTGLVEFISGKNQITTGIQIEQASVKNNKILFSSTTSIDQPSLCRTVETCLLKTSVFMARSVAQYLANPQAMVVSQNLASDSLSNTVMDQLSFSQFFSLSTCFTSRVLKRIYSKFTVDEQWIILLGMNQCTKNATDSIVPNQQLSSFSKIIPPEDEFWADPFLVEHEDKHYLFLEVFPFSRELGHLSCMEIKPDGSYTTPVKILEKPYHLSYPNVFEYQGSYYMIPETGDNQTVELYQASVFPYEWTFKHNLIENIRAYDSSLIFHEGLWWLFATVSVTEACPTTEELYVFYADSPLSTQWTAHANNPVVSDAASARPAGKLFRQGKQLIRPSQDCAGSYGAGINFCDIQILNKKEYKEKILNTLTADWDNTLSGVHTFNFNAKYTVSDAILINKSKGALS